MTISISTPQKQKAIESLFDSRKDFQKFKSAIIAENKIDTINLMKIDAENYEWQVLQGIREARGLSV